MGSIISWNTLKHSYSTATRSYLRQPKYLRWVYKPNDKYSMSACLHDFLYDEPDTTRLHADYIFLLAMKSQGVNLFTRWVFFISVRTFGGRYR